MGGYIGVTEKKMETTIVHRGTMGTVEKKMETTIYGLGFRVISLTRIPEGFTASCCNCGLRLGSVGMGRIRVLKP